MSMKKRHGPNKHGGGGIFKEDKLETYSFSLDSKDWQNGQILSDFGNPRAPPAPLLSGCCLKLLIYFCLLWKHEKFQLLRLWGRKSFDFQTLVAEKFQFYVEIYTPVFFGKKLNKSKIIPIMTQGLLVH